MLYKLGDVTLQKGPSILMIQQQLHCVPSYQSNISLRPQLIFK